MKKYDTVIFFLLAVMVLSIPSGFAFASEDNGDDRYDDDDRDDDRCDDDDRDDDRSSDGSKTSEFFKREVKAETLGFQTEISIEIEFVSNTTDTNQLIDEIIDKFSLTREEAGEELRTECPGDQRLEKKLEVEIEKRGNTSKVEVELETVIDSTSRGDILDAIVKNSPFVHSHKTIFKDAQLMDASLVQSDLYEADFGSANLNNARFYGADLYGANLQNANLRDAGLSNANLSFANFADADLNDANFSNANLQGANLSDADLSGTNFEGADLADTQLTGKDGKAHGKCINHPICATLSAN